MSKQRRRSGAGGRTIDPGEAELWSRATRSLDPLKAKPRVVPSVAAAPPERRATGPAKAHPRPAAASKEPEAAAPAARPAPSAPLADIDRRKLRRIATGRIEIDARIDLHGSRQRDARARLRAFLLDARARGCRTVLVITGKGGDEAPDRLGALMGEAQRGVLRRNVPRWLEEPDLRAVVLGYTEAAVRHGGAGALYVELRKMARE
jgi:DNA-nicking Smr family endonuclease